MNYPVWDQLRAGGGLLIVVIAVVHVTIAHLAVGGGFFLVFTEWMGHHRRQPAMVDYVRRYTRVFLLLTLVLGAVTGVGIWFTISILAPTATAILIHAFVFAWAIEWVFFGGEIIALLIYHYRFDHMRRRDHLIVGGFYALFAWLSLFMINGIIAFMLTPGRWIETGDFWDGFFNPTMWPSLGYRTGMSLMIASLFGLVSAVFSGDKRSRRQLINGCLIWIAGALILSAPFLFWYFKALSPVQQAMILARSPELADAARLLVLSLAVILLGAGALTARLKGHWQKAVVILLLLAGLGSMGGFEWLREGARRPYLIDGHTYANGIPVDQQAAIDTNGMLKQARWVGPGIRTAENGGAGRALFRLQCVGCHSIGGPVNDILPLTRGYTLFGMEAVLTGQGKLSAYMPPFMGTAEERRALGRYLVEDLQGRGDAPAKVVIVPEPAAVPPFDPQSDAYLLLAASPLGMHEFGNAPAMLSFHGPPRATLRAQLIRRGEIPKRVKDGIRMQVSVPGDEPKASDMVFSDALLAWTAEIGPLPVLDPQGRIKPYPWVTLTAWKGNRVIATTRIPLSQSTEMGCGRCHGGTDPDHLNASTAGNILRAHDRRSRTRLFSQAKKGQAVVCATCHQPEVAAADPPLNLSAAVHGFHAVYLAGAGNAACTTCHAADETGATRFFRGIHHGIGLACSNCHGSMTELAQGLLQADSEREKPAAKRILPWLGATGDGAASAHGRRPWVNLPDCLGCHVGFAPPDTDALPAGAWSRNAATRFGNASDDAGLLCISCHGSPHALYPASNPYGRDRDNLIPLQVQREPYPVGANGGCQVCHTIAMEETIHHFNASARFRNTR